jgi:ElaB/YqjD/DUF883 family membrane-anchored ribosome-binding protein
MVTTLKDVASTALDIGRDVKDTVVQFGASAGRKIDEARDQTSDALHAAAASVRKGSAKIDVLAGSAAKKFDTTASFVEDADMKGLLTGARRFAKSHPALTLAVGVAVGFWAGSTLTRGMRAS